MTAMEPARIISRGLQRRLEMLKGTAPRRVIEISWTEATTDRKATSMSASLNKRIAALEAQEPGATLPVAVVWRPHEMTPAEEAAFEAGLDARRQANPRQPLLVFGWGAQKEKD